MAHVVQRNAQISALNFGTGEGTRCPYWTSLHPSPPF